MFLWLLNLHLKLTKHTWFFMFFFLHYCHFQNTLLAQQSCKQGIDYYSMFLQLTRLLEPIQAYCLYYVKSKTYKLFSACCLFPINRNSYTVCIQSSHTLVSYLDSLRICSTIFDKTLRSSGSSVCSRHIVKMLESYMLCVILH